MDDLRMFRELLRTHHAFYNDNPQGLTVELNMDQVVGLYCSLTKVLDEFNQNDWIDVNDRLPIETKNNKYQEYYVTIKNNLTGSIYVDEAYYIDKEWKSTTEEYDCEIKSFEDVIAWKVKHIPEPYTKGVK